MTRCFFVSRRVESPVPKCEGSGAPGGGQSKLIQAKDFLSLIWCLRALFSSTYATDDQP